MVPFERLLKTQSSTTLCYETGKDSRTTSILFSSAVSGFVVSTRRTRLEFPMDFQWPTLRGSSKVPVFALCSQVLMEQEHFQKCCLICNYEFKIQTKRQSVHLDYSVRIAIECACPFQFFFHESTCPTFAMKSPPRDDSNLLHNRQDGFH